MLRIEYRSKLLNPRWADAMAAQGSGGAYEISQRMTALLVRAHGRQRGARGKWGCARAAQGCARPREGGRRRAGARRLALGVGALSSMLIKATPTPCPLIIHPTHQHTCPSLSHPRPRPGLGRDHWLPGPVDVGPGERDVRARP